MKSKQVIFMLFLASCNFTEDYWEGAHELYGTHFQWVEPGKVITR